MLRVEVEFTYLVQPATAEQRDAFEAAAERTAALNKHLSGYDVGPTIPAGGGNGSRMPVGDDAQSFTARLYSGGHDRSAITRRIVAPIRNLFHRAGIPVTSIHLTGTRIMPTGRSLTADTGRTPKGTFTDPSLRQMLADDAKVA